MTATAEKVQSEICLFGFVRMKLLFFFEELSYNFKNDLQGRFYPNLQTVNQKKLCENSVYQTILHSKRCNKCRIFSTKFV